MKHEHKCRQPFLAPVIFFLSEDQKRPLGSQ